MSPAPITNRIDALIGKIEVEMLADGASLNLCRYSDEPFNTNEIIWPHWGMAPFSSADACGSWRSLHAVRGPGILASCGAKRPAGSSCDPRPEKPRGERP